MKLYVNLTAGIEHLAYADMEHGVVRIQSSQLESQSLWKVINGLDYQFLIDACLHGVVLRDVSAHKDMSRALFQGIPWIKFAMQMRVAERFGGRTDTITAKVKQHNVTDYFKKFYKNSKSTLIKRDAKAKLDYVIDLLGPYACNNIRIDADCVKSELDGRITRREFGQRYETYCNRMEKRACQEASVLSAAGL